MLFHSLGTWGLVLGAVGVLTLVGVVISGLAAPNPLFSIFTLAGLLLCGLGILLMAVQWLRELIRACAVTIIDRFCCSCWEPL